MPKPPRSSLHSLRLYPVKSMAGVTRDSAVVEPWGLAGDRRWTLVDDTGRVVTQRQQPRLALIVAHTLPDGGIRLHVPGLAPLTVAVPSPVDASPSGAGVDGGTVVVDIFGTKVEAVPVTARPSGPDGMCVTGTDGTERTRGADGGHGTDGTGGAANGTDGFGGAEEEGGVDRRLSAFLGLDVRLVHLDDPARRRPVNPLYARPGETVSFADGFPLLVTTTASLDALNSLVAQGDHPDEGPLPMDRFRPNLVVTGTAPWAEDDWQRIAVGDITFRVTKPCGRCVVTTTDQATAERGKEPLRTLGRYRRFGGKLLFGQNLVPETTGTLRTGDPVTVLD
ncbi:MOSC domain-containing protein [Streptomyces hebeiensis]